MYGKTLEQLPERLEAFLDEFRTEDPDELDRAFRAVRGSTMEFPTPAHVRAQLQRSPGRVQYERLLSESTEIQGRDAKPPDHEPMTAEEAKRILEQLREGRAS